MEPSRDIHERHQGRRAARAGRIAIALVAVVACGLASLSVFTVGSGEYAVVTQFGRPVQVREEPGLGFKYPYQSVNRFDKRLFVYTPGLSEFLTLEKTAVMASGVILWRIAAPKKFFETVFNRTGAESRLGDIFSAELGAAIGRNPLAAFVSAQPGDDAAEGILAQVAAKTRAVALRDYGIEVVDVQLQRFDFPERNRLRVYARMKSERARISMRYRSEGEEEGLKIRAAAAEEKARLLSDAFKVAEQHRGEGEAEAARIYAQSLSQAPDFYRFLRALEASRKFVGAGTTMILPADSELFGLLRKSDHFERGTAAAHASDQPEEATPMR